MIPRGNDSKSGKQKMHWSIHPQGKDKIFYVSSVLPLRASGTTNV